MGGRHIRRVYIAGPYTHGDVQRNVENALIVADMLLREGYAPYVPHLSHYWKHLSPHTYEEWLALGIAYLEVCDAVVRLPGYSPGADLEVAYAKERGIPIFRSVEELLGNQEEND